MAKLTPKQIKHYILGVAFYGYGIFTIVQIIKLFI